MYKLYAFWSAPKAEDVAAFEEHYEKVHFPLAARVPHLESIAESVTSDSFEGAEPLHYRIAEMAFADREAFQASTGSPEWAEMRADSGLLIERFGVGLTVAMGDVVVSDPLRD
ncbi:EthD family reductase [Nocardioides sp. zg-536]|uniref:EthD family reductase n=1 Tax=Nocardioides faecalis TaxID=2803858 RepID=A0A939BYZ8_9ACTN|nr:EthD family reductase [Nocardioides faecalis]MBM9460828.1 EthD family reductase [Nocardioides faecalis]MBS4752767.1 EthD family reductase [Nocardioides faecalis]QVI58016.1 EthD family reductase [Nocardioides faecalis]